MKTEIGKNIRVINPIPELEIWAYKHLRLHNPEYTKKKRLGLWLGKTPEYIYLYQKKGNHLILPIGVFYEIKDFVVESEIEILFEYHPKINYIGEIPLYEYQATAVSKLLKSHFGILQAPAGSGKTQIGIGIIQQLHMKALWLTHTKDLLEQSKSRAEQYLDKNLMGTITDGKINIGEGITFATVQTMANIDLSSYEKEWDVIIVDECHRVAGSPTSVTQFYKVLNNLNAQYKYGLSATVHRADGLIRSAYALLGQVLHMVAEDEITDKIHQVGVCAIDTGVKIHHTALNLDGTLNYQSLITYLTEHESRNKRILAVLEDNANKSCLILSDRLAHLETLIEMLPVQLQPKTRMISGSTKTDERKEILDKMRSGELNMLFATYSLAKEGLDIPRLERLIMATPQKDFAIIAQSIGRIARVTEGKENAICFDFVDDIGFLVRAFKKRKTTYNKKRCYYLGYENII